MKYIFMRPSYASLIIIGFIIIGSSVPCNGSDDAREWECLFCHQYPGLMMPESPDKLKIISIDKEKHFSSPHGSIGCVECHTLVKRVPHTGLAGIECTSECHAEDREKIEAMDLSLYKVHKCEQCSIKSLRNKSSCRICHPLHPHSQNKKVRAILNMHTGYIVCEVCHRKREEIENAAYDWGNYEDVEFIGKPYGRYSTREAVRRTKQKSFISSLFQKKETDQPAATEYVISRIVIFSGKAKKKERLMNTWDTGKAIKFQSREGSLSPGEKEKELQYFHRDITKREFSVACNECHSSNGILDFEKLGYDSKKCGYLKGLDVKRMETEYDIFYFPHMLDVK